MCGKWSSPSSFPAGPGDEIPVKVVRGLGQGKGFEVVEIVSGLENRDLCLAVKEKLLSLTSVFLSHGYITRAELEGAATKPDLVPDPELAMNEVRKWKGRAAKLARDKEHLEVNLSDALRRIDVVREEVEKERGSRELLAVELVETQRELTEARERADSLEAQLEPVHSDLVQEQDHWEEASGPAEGSEAKEHVAAERGALRALVQALEPLMPRIEYVAMDDSDVAAKFEDVRQALDDANDMLGY